MGLHLAFQVRPVAIAADYWILIFGGHDKHPSSEVQITRILMRGGQTTGLLYDRHLNTPFCEFACRVLVREDGIFPDLAAPDQ